MDCKLTAKEAVDKYFSDLKFRKKKMKFNTISNQIVKDIGGKRLVQYYGRCERCNSTLYAFPEGKDAFESDPRGVLTVHHAYSPAVASDHGMQGRDVKFCYECHQNDGEKYKECMVIAKRLWNQSGSTLTDFLMVLLGSVSILALVFTLGALPALIMFAQLATMLQF